MAATIAETVWYNEDSAQPLTVAKPAAFADGQLLIAVIVQHTGSLADLTGPSGWTFEGSHTATACHAKVWSHIYDPGDPSTWDFGYFSTADVVLGLFRIVGNDPSPAIEVVGSGTNSLTSSFDSPTVTPPAGPGDLLICTLANLCNGTALSETDPAGMTDQGQTQVAGNFMALAAATENLLSATPTGVRTWTSITPTSLAGGTFSVAVEGPGAFDPDPPRHQRAPFLPPHILRQLLLNDALPRVGGPIAGPPTPPVFVSESETVWNTGTTPKTASVTVAPGDVLVVCAVTEEGDTNLSTPTGGGLFYQLQQSVDIDNQWTGVYVWAAVCYDAQTFDVSVASTGAASFYGFNASVWSNVESVGVSTKTNVSGAAPTLDLQTSRDQSVVVVANGDFNAADGASRTWRTVNGITPVAPETSGELTYFRDAAHYSLYVGYYSDAGLAGSVNTKTVGLSAPAGQKFSIVALELRGGTAPAAGGTGWTVNQTDDAGLTDTAIFDQTKEFTDSAGLTDTSALDQTKVVTDDAGLTDTATQELLKLVAATDSAGLTDTVAFTQAKVVTDSAGLTDTTAIDQTKVVTDSAGLTDSSTLELAKLVTATDSAGLTDTSALIQQKVATDSAGLTDATAFTQSKVVTDSAGLTDAFTLELARLITQTDSAGLIDAFALQVAQLVADLTGLTDTTNLVSTYSRTATDSSGLTDAVTQDLLKLVAATDSAGLTESAITDFTAGGCDIPRPFTGVIARPSSGTITRPDTGDIADPC